MSRPTQAIRLRAGAAARWALTVTLVASPAVAEEFRFLGLDRTYAGFVQELAPVDMGVATLILRSPEHELTLEEHAVTLEPLADGEHRIGIHLSFNGHGLLDADLKVGVVQGKLADEITLPSQALDLEGRVLIEPSTEGWTITVLEGPESVTVELESQLASRMVPLCKQMALVLVRFDCGALEEAMSRVTVPMPAPGEQFFLAREELTESEAAALGAYLYTHR